MVKVILTNKTNTEIEVVMPVTHEAIVIQPKKVFTTEVVSQEYADYLVNAYKSLGLVGCTAESKKVVKESEKVEETPVLEESVTEETPVLEESVTEETPVLEESVTEETPDEEPVKKKGTRKKLTL